MLIVGPARCTRWYRAEYIAVVFPLFLLGAILVAAFGGGYRAVRRGYEEAELRKMHALDAAGV